MYFPLFGAQVEPLLENLFFWRNFVMNTTLYKYTLKNKNKNKTKQNKKTI